MPLKIYQPVKNSQDKKDLQTTHEHGSHTIQKIPVGVEIDNTGRKFLHVKNDGSLIK
jgi:hypothetical protein